METDQLQAIGDKWSTPTYTLDMAAWIRALLWEKPVGGLIHLTQSGACTWQEYGQFALDCAVEAGLPLKGRTVGFQAMKDLKAFIAKRPVYTVLGTSRLEEITGQKPRPWQEAAAEYVRVVWKP